MGGRNPALLGMMPGTWQGDEPERKPSLTQDEWTVDRSPTGASLGDSVYIIRRQRG